MASVTPAPPTSTSDAIIATTTTPADTTTAAAPAESNTSGGDLTLEVLQRSINMEVNADCKNPQDHQAECRTPAQILDPLNANFAQYGITTVGQKAALISIMDFESGSFRYSTNLNVDHAGQGTFSQMMFPHIKEYVQSIPELAAPYAALTEGVTDLDTNKEVMNKVLALVTVDKYNVGAACWYLAKSAGCGAKTLKVLEATTEEAYRTYLTECINTTVTDDRISGWKRTMAGLTGAQ
ncbi:hypothetical protein BJ085DRAFT_17209 [Dimargaris cristalligena]|uniref:Uncharacterized protein n=1 Tax=Dimargaris cristalligena TaxID=215637 RepID=A0A4P9ZU92_9FUNG|nr:hypothetical protein BJ085DRAFT_17209 [Dimargaris cristalligena]|eukprot:RKP37166.1 hypothetical protein BJ085DRAFT_17209 [Dimargaris cristalligena]